MLDHNAGILLIEDDRVDIMTVQRALKKSGINNPLHIARTGAEALAMLRGDGVPAISPPPALILLDLNLPRMSGIEFLKEMRRDPAISSLDVIVLTSSDEARDRSAAFEYEVEDYIIKPHSFEEFAQVMATVLSYWSPQNIQVTNA